jgi:hypothetical protein
MPVPTGLSEQLHPWLLLLRLLGLHGICREL